MLSRVLLLLSIWQRKTVQVSVTIVLNQTNQPYTGTPGTEKTIHIIKLSFIILIHVGY